MTKFGRLTPGVYAEDPPALADVPQAGTVAGVTAAGAMVVLDEMPGQAYGPAPWTIGSYATFQDAIDAGWCPLVGDRAVVVFAGVGVQTSAIVAWWR